MKAAELTPHSGAKRLFRSLTDQFRMPAGLLGRLAGWWFWQQFGRQGGRLSLGDVRERTIEAFASPNRIDGLETTCRDQSSTRVFRHPVARPLLDCGESIVQRFFGKIKVAEQADQVAKTRRESERSSSSTRSGIELLSKISSVCFAATSPRIAVECLC
ncbi:MAG TPA: hypothetical protein VHX65_17525 [Pirellulales bacterium]|jgi:hypothetical protein|nr:hypothetical protein [Pirellulales bacterium]